MPEEQKRLARYQSAAPNNEKTMIETNVAGILIYCSKCDTTQTYTLNETSINSSSNECDLCGSHGEVRFNPTCKTCGAFIEIIVSEW